VPGLYNTFQNSPGFYSFLRILDDREQQEAEEAEAVGEDFQPSLESPYRWQDWVSPAGTKRLQLQMGEFGGFLTFVNNDLGSM
jgi:type I restriction enzyme M protein